MERMSAKEFLASQAGGGGGDRRRVRGTKPVTIGGITFHSTREGKRYVDLCHLQKAGEIRNLRLQVPFDLFGKDLPILTAGGGKTRRYLADFVYFDCALGRDVIEDAKGHDTDVSELKRAIMAAQNQPVILV